MSVMTFPWSACLVSAWLLWFANENDVLIVDFEWLGHSGLCCFGLVRILGF